LNIIMSKKKLRSPGVVMDDVDDEKKASNQD